jgi:hypothetical protein
MCVCLSRGEIGRERERERERESSAAKTREEEKRLLGCNAVAVQSWSRVSLDWLYLTIEGWGPRM